MKNGWLASFAKNGHMTNARKASTFLCAQTVSRMIRMTKVTKKTKLISFLCSGVAATTARHFP